VRKVFLILTLLCSFTDHLLAQTDTITLPSKFFYQEQYERYSSDKIYTLDLDRTTALYNAERGLRFASIGFVAKPALKQFALLLITGELSKQYKDNKTFASNLFLDDSKADVSPCELVSSQKKKKLRFEISVIKLNEEQFLKFLESEKVTVGCGSVTIQTDDESIQSIRFFAKKLAPDVHFSVNYVDDTTAEGIDISNFGFAFAGDSLTKKYYSGGCKEVFDLSPSTTLYFDNVESVEKAGFSKSAICTSMEAISGQISNSPSTSLKYNRPVRVRSYIRKDGTYVRSHRRSRPKN
jgi:hypothetical protein